MRGDTFTVSSKQYRRKENRRRREQQEKLFRRHATLLTRGHTHYTHKGGKLMKKAGWPVFEAERVVLLSTDKACGRCPLTLICHSRRSWLALANRYILFRCWRCHAVGFTPIYLTELSTGSAVEAQRIGLGGGLGGGLDGRGCGGDKTTLFVCTLLRGGRQALPWSCEKKTRDRAKLWVNTTLSGGDVFATREATLLDAGDIPFGCATRCYTPAGEISVKKLPLEMDCRTTVSNARQAGGREQGVVRF